jgi:hypothetical protein
LQVGYTEEEMDNTKNSYVNIYETKIIDHHSKF